MQLQFLGAAGTVTGSRTMVTHGAHRVLVDCGMFQGFKQLRQRNWDPLELDHDRIDAVVLTHAHLDHAGWLPALVRAGYAGPVYCTLGTADLLGRMLPDSGRIQEEDAQYANKRRFSRHRPALPLYTVGDAYAALELLVPTGWGEIARIGRLKVGFHRAGHILGASSVRIEADGVSVLFSGDLGRQDDLVVPPPDPPPASDYVVIESTYGGRAHPAVDLLTELAAVVNAAVARGGVVLIPSFAVGRAQAVLWALRVLQDDGRIPKIPVVLDSPMAVDTTDIFRRHADDLRLTDEQLTHLCRHVEMVRDVGESKALAARQRPYVLVSASGMLTGGRVLHHLARLAPDAKNTVLFVGYQAPGTRGRRMLDREAQIKIHGRYVAIRADVRELAVFSAHADQGELLGWLSKLPAPPRRLWINHGEPEGSEALRVKVEETLGWEPVVATEGVTWELEGGLRAPAASRQSLSSEGAVVPPPSTVRADLDPLFLDRDDMRSVRLMLEYQKVETSINEAGVGATVVVFGSARVGSSTEEYAAARQFGRLVAAGPGIAGQPVAVVTGGGPGVMEAANRGALEAGGVSVGFGITLPREQHLNAYLSPGLAFEFRYFALRKMHFLRRAKALVAFPGGFGTFDELMDALCLIQTGKLPRIPVVAVGEAFWREVLPFERLARAGLIAAEDVALVDIVATPEEAWDRISAWHARR